MGGSFPAAQAISAAQFESLKQLLREVIPANPFYTTKFKDAAIANLPGLAEFTQTVPFTTKQELVEDQRLNPLYGTNLTYSLDRYSRFNQTSGTSGRPLRWLDTPESWEALTQCWIEVHRAAGVTERDAAYFAFSFGPFLGFWLAFEAAARLGCLSLPGGGLSSLARLTNIIELKATVLCCTPSYAIHLADVARAENLDLTKSHVRLIIVAGEPGGSVPATRAQIERQWPGARVFDHHGMTEVGPVTFECPARACRLHVIDSAYLAEVIDPSTLAAVPPGTPGELVLTTLKRAGSPLIRYRTGDLVQKATHHAKGLPCECGRYNTTFEGGIQGRTDDMVVVRGVNIYPTAVEEIVRRFEGVVEYQVRITKKGALTEMHVVVEAGPRTKNPAALVAELEKALQTALNLRIPVTAVAENSLPRAELKARRWVKNSG